MPGRGVGVAVGRGVSEGAGVGVKVAVSVGPNVAIGVDVSVGWAVSVGWMGVGDGFGVPVAEMVGSADRIEVMVAATLCATVVATRSTGGVGWARALHAARISDSPIKSATMHG